MSRVALCDARGPLTDLIEKLSGEDGSEWLRILNAALRKQNPFAAVNLLTRTVTPDRSRSPQAMLDATGRRQYIDKAVVAAMPRGTGETVEVVLFTLVRFVSDAELEKEYGLRSLIPADPYSLAAVNEADPTFADSHPNGTHWKDADGNWCFATFDGWGGERRVRVYRHGSGWHDRWWFAGVRK